MDETINENTLLIDDNESGDPEFGISLFGLDVRLQRIEADQANLEHQQGLLNARVGDINTKLESTVAVVNKSISNSGYQFLAGDVGLASVLGITVFICFGIVGWTQYQLQKLKKTIVGDKLED